MVKIERKRTSWHLLKAPFFKVIFFLVVGTAVVWMYTEYLTVLLSSILQAASFSDIQTTNSSTKIVDIKLQLWNSKFAGKKILVAYSGPTSLNRAEKKNELYFRNFDFFLKHGVDCRYQDTVIALTESVKQLYHEQLLQMDQHCQASGGHRVYTLIRDKECHDLATVYTLFYNSTIQTDTYDFFVYINCGMSGPSPNYSPSWVMPFINPLTETVKMSGLSVNCHHKQSPHVQSMAFALDRVGLKEVLRSDSIFDCRQRFPRKQNRFNKIVAQYEKGMSKAILQAGYGLASIIWPGIVFWENRTNCTLVDEWVETNLKLSFGGRLPHLNETIFFKSSRLLPKEIAELIDYPGEPSWHSI
jgi:hypothetical protein